MKRTIKNTIAVIGAIAMFSTTGAMLPSAEVYGAHAQTAAVFIAKADAEARKLRKNSSKPDIRDTT